MFLNNSQNTHIVRKRQGTIKLLTVIFVIVDYDTVINNSAQVQYWPTNEFNAAIPLWTNGYDQGLFPLLAHQQQHNTYHHQHQPSLDDLTSPIGSTSDASSVAQSPCYVTSSPSSSTFSSITSPTHHQHYSAPPQNPACSNPDTPSAVLLPPTTTPTPLASLQRLTREALIDRVLELEQELIYCHSSESPKQDGWQCRWDACDTVTSTLEQLTDHLYRIHVGRGKVSSGPLPTPASSPFLFFIGFLFLWMDRLCTTW